jgi:hypothetical protein
MGKGIYSCQMVANNHCDAAGIPKTLRRQGPAFGKPWRHRQTFHDEQGSMNQMARYPYPVEVLQPTSYVEQEVINDEIRIEREKCQPARRASSTCQQSRIAASNYLIGWASPTVRHDLYGHTSAHGSVRCISVDDGVILRIEPMRANSFDSPLQ